MLNSVSAAKHEVTARNDARVAARDWFVSGFLFLAVGEVLKYLRHPGRSNGHPSAVRPESTEASTSLSQNDRLAPWTAHS
jgi:hypothetical protein